MPRSKRKMPGIMHRPERDAISMAAAEEMLATAVEIEALVLVVPRLRAQAHELLRAVNTKSKDFGKEEPEEPMFLPDDEVVKRLEAMSPGMRAQFEQALRDVVGEA